MQIMYITQVYADAQKKERYRMHYSFLQEKVP